MFSFASKAERIHQKARDAERALRFANRIATRAVNLTKQAAAATAAATSSESKRRAASQTRKAKRAWAMTDRIFNEAEAMAASAKRAASEARRQATPVALEMVKMRRTRSRSRN